MFIHFGHPFQYALIKYSRDCRHAHQDGWLDILNHFSQSLELLSLIVVTREILFVLSEFVASVICD